MGSLGEGLALALGIGLVNLVLLEAETIKRRPTCIVAAQCFVHGEQSEIPCQGAHEGRSKACPAGIAVEGPREGVRKMSRLSDRVATAVILAGTVFAAGSNNRPEPKKPLVLTDQGSFFVGGETRSASPDNDVTINQMY